MVLHLVPALYAPIFERQPVCPAGGFAQTFANFPFGALQQPYLARRFGMRRFRETAAVLIGFVDAPFVEISGDGRGVNGLGRGQKCCHVEADSAGADDSNLFAHGRVVLQHINVG